jgi:3',5'-nucleoside bisphosphate phosphatase
VARARAGRLDLIALADHDTIAGVAEAIEAAGSHPTVVPAIEISATHASRDVHILGYFVDHTAPALVEYSQRARIVREERIHEMIARLATLDVVVDFEAVVDEAGPGASSLARPHLARAMQAGGHVRSVAEAFDRFIGDDGPAFVAARILDVPDSVRLIHDAGGMAVWAHPPLNLLDDYLPAFVDAGMDGLECYRPRIPDPDLQRLLSEVRRHGLLATGGSDWHGDWHGDLGAFHLTPAQVRGFLDQGGVES